MGGLGLLMTKFKKPKKYIAIKIYVEIVEKRLGFFKLNLWAQLFIFYFSC
jgi:hypothetical protein